MVTSEMLVLIYFVTLMFLGNHSITVQRGERDSFEKTLNNCADYNGNWNSSTSCKCFAAKESVLMSNDEEMYGCKGMESTGCIGITLIDDQTNEIKTGCKSLGIKAIYIWGLRSTTANHGLWFNETKSAEKYFHVTNSSIISAADIDMDQWSGQLVKLEVESKCSPENPKTAKCYLVRFKGTVEYPFDLKNFDKIQNTTIAAATTTTATTATTTRTSTTTISAEKMTVPAKPMKTKQAMTETTYLPHSKITTKALSANYQTPIPDNKTTVSTHMTTSTSTPFMAVTDKRKADSSTLLITIIVLTILFIMVILVVVTYLVIKKRSSNRKDLKCKKETPMRDVAGKNQDQRLSKDYSYTNPYFETSPSAPPTAPKPSHQTTTQIAKVCSDISPKSDVVLVNDVYDTVVQLNHVSPNIYTSVDKTKSHSATSKNVGNTYVVLSKRNEESYEPLKKVDSQTIRACNPLNATSTSDKESYQSLVKSDLKTGEYALPDTGQTYASLDKTHPNNYTAPNTSDPKTHSNDAFYKDPYYHVLEDADKTSSDPLHTNGFKKTTDAPKRYAQLDMKEKNIYQPLKKSPENPNNMRDTKPYDKVVSYALLEKPAETKYQELNQPSAGENKTIMNAQGIYEQPQMSNLPSITNKHAAIENLVYQKNLPNYDEILSAEIISSQDVNHYSSPYQEGNVYHVLEACK